MSKQLEISINDFNGGISDDARKSSANEFQITKHFDIFTNPKRLTPYRSLEADTETAVSATDLKQYVVKDFLYGSTKGTTTTAELYGLGQTGAGLTKIFYKADATSGLWTKPASSEGNGAVQNGCFVEYKDYLWGFQGTNQVWKWGLLSGTPSITNSVNTTASTITSVAQGVVAKDDDLYLPYNNIIARVTTGGTFTDSVLTLPTNLKITSICNYGNYLAIGCAPIASYNGVSKVFLWNLTSPDVTETIDWGEGELRVLETIEGLLVGITDRYLNNATGAGKGSMVVQIYSGGSPQVVKEVFTQALTGKTIPQSKVVKNNRVFWAAKIMTNSAGTTYNEGLWSFGRKNSGYLYALTLDIIDENINTSGIQAFGTAANYFYIAHSADGSVDKTNDAATYTFTSILESQIYDAGDRDSDKTLLSCKASFRALAAGEVVTLKYRIDGATAWTTIGSASTDGDISHTFLNIESTGDAFASGREYEFRVESTGGAEPLGIKPLFRINDNAK
jgi:hypothetical protein